jgi:hypothetical protein
VSERNFDFIIDSMQWSFSRVNSFHNCAYCWLLNYIECTKQESNFFAEYGLLVHATLEKFFKNELEIYELAPWYQENYKEFVKTPAPPFPVNMEGQYYDAGLEYFENFDFPKDEYDVISVEDSFNIEYENNNVIIKPDLVLRNKKSQKYILVDYKSSVLFKETNSDKNVVYLSKDGVKEKYTFKSKDKIEDLKKYVFQMYLYCLGLKEKYGIQIDEIRLWFIRQDRELIFNFNQLKGNDATSWFLNEISNIKNEREWKPVTFGLDEKELKKKFYWCNYICGYRAICSFKPEGNSS